MISRKKISQQHSKLLSRYNDPKLISSMINAISKEGYSASSIKDIDFISYELNKSCNYSKPKITKIISVNKHDGIWK